MARPDREYLSDDCDLEANRLHLMQGENGDWYLSIRKPGERVGVAVRITTSGTRAAQRDVPTAVYDLYRAMGGEQLGTEHQRLADACGRLIEQVDPEWWGDTPAAIEALGLALADVPFGTNPLPAMVAALEGT